MTRAAAHNHFRSEMARPPGDPAFARRDTVGAVADAWVNPAGCPVGRGMSDQRSRPAPTMADTAVL